jgi:hypothetical protein
LTSLNFTFQVRDLDFDSTGTRIVAADKGPRAILWRTVDGSVERELEWQVCT